jgi:hypothetical protein
MSAFVGGLTAFLVPTHLLAVVALGLLAAQAGHRAISLTIFGIALAAGSLTVASAINEVPSTPILLALGATAGCLVTLGCAPPPLVAPILIGAAGVAIPLNAPPREVTIPAGMAAQVGTAAAALVLFALIISIAAKADRPWQVIGVRIVGSWVTASTIMVLALRLAR